MIRDWGVSRRYAAALFGAAVKGGEEREVLADLESFDLLFQSDRALQHFLEAPDVLTEAKVALVRRVLEGRVRELTIRFLLLMLEKKRIQHFPLVFEHFRARVEEHHGIARARVVTAVPLAADLAEALRRRLERLSGQTVHLDPRTDPAILGGAVVTINGRIIDGSVRHRLNEMRDRMLAARVH